MDVTTTISDWNAGTFICTTVSGPYDVTYIIPDNVTLTNS
jgi:hypothetical protein